MCSRYSFPFCRYSALKLSAKVLVTSSLHSDFVIRTFQFFVDGTSGIVDTIYQVLFIISQNTKEFLRNSFLNWIFLLRCKVKKCHIFEFLKEKNFSISARSCTITLTVNYSLFNPPIRCCSHWFQFYWFFAKCALVLMWRKSAMTFACNSRYVEACIWFMEKWFWILAYLVSFMLLKWKG